MAKAYWEKLKDPQWQKKRLEALQRADFACELCGDSENTLHVHHKEYFKGRDPWEYDLDQLAVLCEACHAEQHSEDDRLKLICSRLHMDGPMSRGDIADLIEGYVGCPRSGSISSPSAYFAGVVASALTGFMPIRREHLARLHECVWSHPDEFIASIKGFIDKCDAGEGK